MHHPAVAVHAQKVLDAAGARAADPGDVVAGQVHEHDVLGDLLGIGAQLQLAPHLLGHLGVEDNRRTLPDVYLDINGKVYDERLAVGQRRAVNLGEA